MVVEVVEDMQMGTMPFLALNPAADNQEVETILQPISTGMIIQGLEVVV